MKRRYLNHKTISPAKHWGFIPDYLATSILDLDLNYLQENGIKALLIDLDGTVVNRGTFEVNKDISNHLAAANIPIYIATNRPSSRDLKNLQDDVRASGVIHPRGFRGKPFPRYYLDALRDLDLEPTEVAMVGDSFIQDILGANAAGLKTIAVQKFGTETKLGYKLQAWLEQRFINHISSRFRLVSSD